MTQTKQNRLIHIMSLFFIVITIIPPDICMADSENTPARSQFADKLNHFKYQEIRAPDITPLFRWDFSGNAVHRYAFSQEVRVETDMGANTGKAPGTANQHMTADGSLTIKSQGDGTAEFVLKDTTMKMEITPGNGLEPRTIEGTMPPIIIQGMTEGSQLQLGDSSQEMLIRLLFPLPPETLKTGETVEVTARMPFNAMGSRLQVIGHYRITLTRYVAIAGRPCARFDVNIDISDPIIPEGISGEFTSSMQGASVYFFDVENRRFVEGATAVLMKIGIDAPMPSVKINGKTAGKLPARARISMTSDNFIRVNLKQ